MIKTKTIGQFFMPQLDESIFILVALKKDSFRYPFFGAPRGIRTPDLPVRSRTLYPAKPWVLTLLLIIISRLHFVNNLKHCY